MHQPAGGTQVIGDGDPQQHVTSLADTRPGQQTPRIVLAQGRVGRKDDGKHGNPCQQIACTEHIKWHLNLGQAAQSDQLHQYQQNGEQPHAR